MSQEWTIPLQIKISLGTPVLAPGPSAASVAAATPSAAARSADAAAGSVESAGAPYIDKFEARSLVRSGLDWEMALSLALAARLAYEDGREVKRVTDGWSLKNCLFIDQDDTQCFLAASVEVVLIAFRGSETKIGDWLANFDVITTTRDYGKVHRGFLGAFKIVEDALLRELAKHGGKPIVLTGHSLGGALALVAAAEWADRMDSRLRVSAIHTFGQPAVGMSDFRGYVNARFGEKYQRFVNDMDLVPMVPPVYRHAGELIHFAEDGSLENALGGEELESLGIDLGTFNAETPMMDKGQFDEMRARLLMERAKNPGAELSEESVERAALESTGQEGVEGFLPNVSDHKMDRYVEKIASKAGF